MGLPPVERQQSVLSVLQNLRGMEPLKKLFWSELNYDKVNKPLSRRGWGDQAAAILHRRADFSKGRNSWADQSCCGIRFAGQLTRIRQ